MANTNNLKESLNKKNEVQKPSNGMRILLKQMENEIKSALPSMVTSERFLRVALTAFNSNPKLQECDPHSFLGAMMTSAQLGLEPNTPLGQAYLIPFGRTVQFQIGYKGLLELAQRSNKVKTIYAHTVHKNDDFTIEYGLEQNLIHKPNFKTEDRGEVLGYYAVYKLVNGGEMFYFMTKNEIEKFARKFSKTFNSGPWQTDFDAMAKKTVIKQLLKYAPISIEMANAINNDGVVRNEIKADMLEDAPIENDYIEIDAETGEVKE